MAREIRPLFFYHPRIVYHASSDSGNFDALVRRCSAYLVNHHVRRPERTFNWRKLNGGRHVFIADDRTIAVGLDDPSRLVENQTVADFKIRTPSRHRDEASAFGSRACSEKIWRTVAPHYRHARGFNTRKLSALYLLVRVFRCRARQNSRQRRSFVTEVRAS